MVTMYVTGHPLVTAGMSTMSIDWIPATVIRGFAMNKSSAFRGNWRTLATLLAGKGGGKGVLGGGLRLLWLLGPTPGLTGS